MKFNVCWRTSTGGNHLITTIQDPRGNSIARSLAAVVSLMENSRCILVADADKSFLLNVDYIVTVSEV